MFRIVLFLLTLAISFLGTPVNTAKAQYPIFLGTGQYRLPWVEPMYTTPSFSSTKTAVRIPGVGVFNVRDQFELDRLMVNLERSGRIPPAAMRGGQGTQNTQSPGQPSGLRRGTDPLPLPWPGQPAARPCQPPTGPYNSFFGGYPMQRCYPNIGS